MLEDDWKVSAEVWSATSFNELRRDGIEVERWNRLHPGEEKRVSYVRRCLTGRGGVTVAASDYMKVFTDQIRAFVPGPYRTLGTDGFGRSDTREQLRAFFEVDRRHIVVSALASLAENGEIESDAPAKAIAAYGIDPNAANPATA